MTQSTAQSALWFIETNLQDRFDLDEIAAASAASRYHVCRAFSQGFGISPMQYAQRRRLAEAVALLRKGRSSIIDIALACGYECQSSFSRSFAAVYGISPGRFRKSRQVNIPMQEPLTMTVSSIDTPKPARFVQRPSFMVAGLVRRYTMETNGSIPGQWAEFLPRQSEIAGQVDDHSYGLCFANQEDGSFAYMTGVEVEEDALLPTDFTRLNVDSATYAIFEHHGSAATLRDTVFSIWDRGLAESGCRPAQAPDFEYYPESYDPTDRHGIVEIWVPLEESSRPVESRIEEYAR